MHVYHCSWAHCSLQWVHLHANTNTYTLACLATCIIPIYMETHPWQIDTHVCLPTCIYIHRQLDIHVHLSTYIHTYLHWNMQAYTYTCLATHIYTHSCMSAYIQISTCIQHICIYALIHICMHICERIHDQCNISMMSINNSCSID